MNSLLIARGGFKETIKVLMDHHAADSVSNIWEETPSQLAHRNGIDLESMLPSLPPNAGISYWSLRFLSV